MTNELEKTSEKLKDLFSRVVIYQCTMCGGFLSEEEFEQYEGVCSKHWDE